jgi:adenylate kinase
MTGEAMIVVLMGPPGAGKGTQAGRLAERQSVAHVASGDLFREALAAGTPLGQQAKGYMDRGELVPDDIVVKMVLERLAKPDCDRGVILDGFPRTAAQAEALDGALAAQGRRVDAALLMEVPEAAILERMTGRRICRNCQAPYHIKFNPPAREGVCDRCGGALYQRDDDREETVRHRLQVYQQQTLPLVSYYRQHKILRQIDGLGEVDEITSRLVRALAAGAD